MKTIPTYNGSIDLPDSWGNLSLSQKIVAFSYLKELSEGKISPSVFRLRMLQELTGYKPQKFSLLLFGKRISYFLALPFVAFYSFLVVKKHRREVWRQSWIEKYKPQSNDRETINYNLYRLSELLDFAFKIKENTITLNNVFRETPIHYILVDGIKYEGKKFIRDIAPFTNITGREFADCFDLYVGYNNTQHNETKERALNKMISILFPFSENYNENLVSKHSDRIASIDPGIKFGIYLWFSGIVEFYITHEYYSILFNGYKSENGDDKVNLGMNEVMLMITKQGYNENDNLNHIFDAQLKILKDSLSDAVAKGTTIKQIADSTGLSINDINRLI